MNEHLERAKAYLVIAESNDSKREAYIDAADEIAAYKDESGDTWADIAISVQRSEPTVRKLMTWRRSGYKAESPFLMDQGATGRAERSHTRKHLREQTTEEIADLIGDLPREKRRALRDAIDEQLHDETFPKARQARERQERERKERHTLRYLEADTSLDKLKRHARELLDTVRGVDFADDERDLLVEDIGKVKASLDLSIMAIEGSAEIDWDAELMRIS